MPVRLVGPLAAALVVALVAPALADDRAAAEVAYDRAKELAKAGNYVDACPLFEASYKADPQLGVLLNLADCHEKIGRIATAWVEFRNAAELAKRKSDNREAYATGRIEALAPRLDKLRLTPPSVAIAGLVVMRDDSDVTLVLGTDIPVDPGEHTIAATAPGYAAWKTTVKIQGEGTLTTTELPTLAKLPDPPGPKLVDAVLVARVDPTIEQRRWGGIDAVLGLSIDGLTSKPSTDAGGSSSGPRSPPSGSGSMIGGRVRINLSEHWAFEPGLTFHYRPMYLELCEPCHELATVRVFDLEVPALFRLALASGFAKPAILVGPYVAARLKTSASNVAAGVMPPIDDPAKGDVGVMAAFELVLGRVGLQIQFQVGFLKLSAEVDQSILGISGGLVVHI